MPPMRLLLAALFLLLAGCQVFPLPDADEASSDVLVIGYGASFGFCVGYCHTEYRLTATSITRVRTGRPAATHPTQTTVWPMDPAAWPRLRAHAERFLRQRPEAVYGCPDCADGGAEWIEVEGPRGPYRTTFEYGRPPEVLAPFHREIQQVLEGVLLPDG